MSTPTLLGRPPERTDEIVRELRGLITRGDLAPGVQLPTRSQIELQFSASSVTVQRALQELQRDGFVTVNGRQGTFVSSTPPHLTNYALVFPTVPSEEGWNRFFMALNQEAPGLARTMGRQIAVYYGADSHSDNQDYRRLLRDAKAQRLGGIIFASVPKLLLGTPILEVPNIPRVAIMKPSPQFDMPQINLERNGFWERCAEKLNQLGRRNLAILMTTGQISELEAVRQKMLDHGFNVPPQWMQVIARDCPESTRNLTHLLFERGRQRPDAFFVTDDNYVEHAIAGLIMAGVRVPDEVEVIAHCNFPHPVPSSVPVHRLGFDARRVLKACFESLDAQRSGQTAAPVTEIPAQFEIEVSVH